ncbi:hypothetical protein Q3H58_002203 [Pseudomonas psychrotolerans]|nr:hypothetical protein [Pseudomonas psychrotolerans]
MLDATEQGGQADDAVHVQHHRGVDGIAGQGWRMVVAHHDRQDDHLHQHGGEGQDHGAIGIADLFRQQFGVVGHAHGGANDGGDQATGGDQRQGLATAEQRVLEHIGQHRGTDGDQQ